MPDLAAFQRTFARDLLADACGREPAFAVYRNTVARGTVEALRAAYPTVDMLLGEESFTNVALDHRRTSPPRSPVLSDYGADFPGWLSLQPWSGELPYLADVARIDRLWLECFLAATDDRATRLCWFETPAVTIWLAHRGPDGVEQIEPAWQGEGALICRRGANVTVHSVDKATFDHFSILKGENHGDHR